jgi:hypothetical protein
MEGMTAIERCRPGGLPLDEPATGLIPPHLLSLTAPEAQRFLRLLQANPAAAGQEQTGLRPNTDDNALLEFSAPKTLYIDTSEANFKELSGYSRGATSYLRQ